MRGETGASGGARRDLWLAWGRLCECAAGRVSHWEGEGGRKKVDDVHTSSTDSRPAPSLPSTRPQAPAKLLLSLAGLPRDARPWWPLAVLVTGKFYWQRTLEGRHGALQRCFSRVLHPCFTITKMKMTILEVREQKDLRNGSKRANEQTGTRSTLASGQKSSRKVSPSGEGPTSTTRGSPLPTTILPSTAASCAPSVELQHPAADSQRACLACHALAAGCRCNPTSSSDVEATRGQRGIL
ncbi:hypothetical protein QBC39DRAFT_127302 [Podospora conica]|nr:hypothetical protein QBC39DRAFT_127302 [Schizothecium conicum]